jgi:hypothetical protein
MRKSFTYILLFLTISLSGQRIGIIASSVSTTSTLYTGLISYWQANDASGNLTDAVTGNTGIVTNGTPTYSVSGKVGTAITFAGAEHFLVGTTTSLRLPQITVSFTFKTTTNAYQGLVTDQWDDGTNHYGFAVTTEGNVVGARANYGTGLGPIVYSTTDITSGAWFHVVFTSDGTNIKLYINGTQEGGDVSFPYNLVYDANCNFDIGARNNGGIPFTGILDEIKIWDHALIQSEITEDYYNVTNGIPLL